MWSSRCCIETQQCSFGHDLLYTYGLVTQMVVTVRRCAVFSLWQCDRQTLHEIGRDLSTMTQEVCSVTSVCLYSCLSYAACTAHLFFAVSCILSSVACAAAPCFVRLVSLMAVLSEKLLNTKCVLWFSVQLLYQTCLVLIRIRRDVFINVCTGYSWQILMKPEFSRQIFEKSSNIKFNQNPSRGSAWS